MSQCKKLTKCLEFTKLLNMTITDKNLQQALQISHILRCISNPKRLLITCMLSEGERCVREILSRIGTTKGNISQHLKLLELNGLITSRRDGNRIYYSIADNKIRKLLQHIKKIYCADIRFKR